MNVVLTIPDDLAERLSAGGKIERQALEALAADAYRFGHLTKPELCRLLGFEVLNEFDGFLKTHQIYEPFTIAEIDQEVAAAQRLGF